uniref:natterin-3-like isoform X2 n=1 Tax=Doryrhamphus excisus TaxID=161450 RepID=UPI0025AE7901|nr:natterin-3-like isoform X2 [Doryrhamphus excisus]
MGATAGGRGRGRVRGRRVKVKPEEKSTYWLPLLLEVHSRPVWTSGQDTMTSSFLLLLLLTLPTLTWARPPGCEDLDSSSSDFPGTHAFKYSKCATSRFFTWLDQQLDLLDSSLVTLDPALENRQPERQPPKKPNKELPPSLRSNIAKSQSFNFDESNLEWKTTYGDILQGAVSIYNSYYKRVDYICKVGCDAGYYNPQISDVCNFNGYGASPFEMLVNKDHFEVLLWKPGSYGSVTPTSIKTCQNEDIYVGKNQYGLGNVKVSDQAFYLAWGGTEYWYRDYQVLEVEKDVRKEDLMDIQYHTDGIAPIEYPPEILNKDTVDNKNCQIIKRTSTLSKSISRSSKWDTTFTFTAGVGTTIKTKIPFIVEGKIQFRVSASYKLVKGTTLTETTTHSLSVDTVVPIGHSCTITMQGKKYGLDIPYTARLKRTYSTGETTWTSITGTYRSVQVSEVQAVVDRCQPLPDVKPC